MASVKRNIDSVIAELKALKEVGVIDAATHRKAVGYVDNHEAEVDEMLVRLEVSDAADEVVKLTKAKGSSNPVGYRREQSTNQPKENDDMATKGKGRKAKGKKGKAKRTSVKSGGEVRNRDSIANYIRAELDKAGKDYDAAKIAAKAQEKYPDKKPTAGYVNWIQKNAPKVSTTTTVAA